MNWTSVGLRCFIGSLVMLAIGKSLRISEWWSAVTFVGLFALEVALGLRAGGREGAGRIRGK